MKFSVLESQSLPKDSWNSGTIEVNLHFRAGHGTFQIRDCPGSFGTVGTYGPPSYLRIALVLKWPPIYIRYRNNSQKNQAEELSPTSLFSVMNVTSTVLG